jgi:glycosyltransferase involved in cell wall biosynthesis
MNTDKAALTVILPALNEEIALPQSVAALIPILKEYTKTYQIIIVDDGSTDNTYQVATQLKEKYSNVKVIKNDKNLGIGSSYKNALCQVTTEYVTWLPSDGEIPPKQLIEPLQKLKSYSCIITYPDNAKEIRSWFRYTLSKYYQEFFRFLFVAKIKYFNGVTFFNTEMLKQLNTSSTGFTFTAETVITFLNEYKTRKNLFLQLPFSLAPRQAGNASAIRLKVLMEVLQFIIRLKLKFKKRLILSE